MKRNKAHHQTENLNLDHGTIKFDGIEGPLLNIPYSHLSRALMDYKIKTVLVRCDWQPETMWWILFGPLQSRCVLAICKRLFKLPHYRLAVC